MSADKIRVGVVGVGYLGRIHAEKYAGIPEAELIGVADSDEQRCREVAAQTHCQPFFHHQDLAGRVQAVSIAVPTLSHYEVTRDFLMAGVDCLLEKPIASTVAEAQELNALAKEKDVILQIGHLERFNGALAGITGLVRNPLLIESYRLSPFSGRGIDVDVIRDLMIHDIDIILSIVGSEIERIEATGMPLCSLHIDCAHACICFKNGCAAHLSASRISPERLRSMVILQKDACLSVDYLRQSLTITRREKGGRTGIEVHEAVQKNDPLAEQAKAFLQSCRARSRPLVTGEDGQRALEVAIRIADLIEKAIT